MKLLDRITNLVAASNISWGRDYPAGYHTIKINDEILKGQRNPKERVDKFPDETFRSVLDIGCNTGGILREFQDRYEPYFIVGIDCNPQLINIANMVCDKDIFDFYTFDLEKEDPNLIKNFLWEEKADVVLLLAVCLHIKNWKEVIDFAHSVSHSMIFEAAGDEETQRVHISYLMDKYPYVKYLSMESNDDILHKNRKLLYLKRSL